MNEKIKKLAEQSGFFPVPDETEWDWDYRAENARYERFAELIIKESIIDFYRRYLDTTSNEDITVQVERYINDHFGVEE